MSFISFLKGLISGIKQNTIVKPDEVFAGQTNNLCAIFVYKQLTRFGADFTAAVNGAATTFVIRKPTELVSDKVKKTVAFFAMISSFYSGGHRDDIVKLVTGIQDVLADGSISFTITDPDALSSVIPAIDKMSSLNKLTIADSIPSTLIPLLDIAVKEINKSLPEDRQINFNDSILKTLFAPLK